MTQMLPIGLPMRGNPNTMHVKGKHLGNASRGCPAFANLDMRPNVWPDIAGWRPEKDRHPFLLGVIHAAIAAIAHGTPVADAVDTACATVSRDGVPLHPGVRSYVRHALAQYLEVHESLCAECGELQLRPHRLMEGAGWKMTAYGLWYATADNSVREVRRCRIGSARGSSDDDHNWALVAAKLAVDGPEEGWSEPGPEPQLVRVLEVGLADGSVHVTFTGTPQQAREQYDAHVKPAVQRLRAGTALRPGWDCARCNWVTACPAVSHVSGLLGQPRYVAPARSVSASDLDRYTACPSLFFMRSVAYLPGETTTGIAQRRGIAVHLWLAAAHSRDGHPGCTLDDLPEDGDTAGVHAGVLTPEEYKVARPYLVRHVLEGCPLGFGDTTDVTVEPRLSVYDPAANVLVVAAPDLTFRAGPRHVWRETKSTTRELPADEFEALETFLAAAVDLLLLHDHVPDGGDDADVTLDGVLELEVLRTEDSRLYLFDTRDAALVSAARHQLASAAYRWHDDVAFTATPGSQCRWCSVRRWCPDRQTAATGGEAGPRELVDAVVDPADQDPF